MDEILSCMRASGESPREHPDLTGEMARELDLLKARTRELERKQYRKSSN